MSRHAWVDPADVQIVSPVPPHWWPQVWDWLNELPECNRDDDGPQSWQELADARVAGAMQGEVTCGVLYRGAPVGYMAYTPITSRVGMTRGLVFTQATHGTGVPYLAVERLLKTAFEDSGLLKIQATYYAHNLRVAAFLRHFGFTEEGCLKDQFTQQGRPVSMKIVARFARQEEPCRLVAH